MPRPSLSSPRTAAFLNALTVGRPDSGKSLLDYLATRFGLSRRAAKAIIDGRSVWVNRRCVWIAHHALKTGDLKAACRQQGKDGQKYQRSFDHDGEPPFCECGNQTY